MMIKYRVHEVAKDLEVPSKEVIELLGKYYEEPHKHMTALTEDELSLVFEHYTKERAVENFDAYFETREKAIREAAAKKEAAAKEAAAREAAAREAAAKDAAAKEAAAREAAKTAPANSQPAARAPQQGGQRPQQGFGQQSRSQGGQQRPGQGRFPQRPGQGRPQGGQQRPGAQRAPQQGSARPAAQQPRSPQPKAPAADHTVRRVDTRGAQVELDKYNEHYEQIVPENARRSYNMQHKQKLRQRSADRRPAYAKRESEAEKLKRLQFEKAKKAQLKVSIPEEIAVGELAARLKVTASEVIKRLMKLGVMASISQTVDFDTASLIAIELGAKVEKEIEVTIEDQLIDDSEDKPEDLKPRSPVVVVMGHVDHGKTSLLDAIRHTNVVAGEAGGITQHIGAYRVKVKDREITFLDTPGHAAFTAMRARGAMVTDIAVIVVAADDGIMPQTVEAINHAKAAKVSIIVAINKIDKPGANPDRVKQELTEHGLVPEEWGGETICVPVSAVKHENIDKLLEMIQLVAELKELKANPDRAGTGAVIEARLDKGRGPVATLLVQNGTLHAGDVIIAGTAVGHIRVMTDERGRRIEHAGPSVPVEVAGLSEVPQAGDIFHAVKDEKMARQLVEQRRAQEKEEQFKSFTKVTLDNLFAQMQEGEVKELNLIVKADVQGSVEAVTQSLEKLSSDEVRVKVIHGAVGPVNESDVYLAESSNAIIIGFNVRPETDAQARADESGVEMRMYRVIYDCIADVQSAMKGMLAPKQREVQLGRLEVRQVYKISSVGTIAGCYVLEGKVTRNAQIRLVRDGIVITDDKIASLKRFKDDVKEVVQGYECGLGLEKFNDIKEGDIFEPYVIEEYRD